MDMTVDIVVRERHDGKYTLKNAGPDGHSCIVGPDGIGIARVFDRTSAERIVMLLNKHGVN